MQGSVGIDEAALARLQLHGQDLAHVAVGEQRLQGGVGFERVRRGNELGDELRLPPGGLEHAPPLGGVHGHARLAEHMLACFERGQRQLAVHVGPRADADRVDVRGGHHLSPIVVHAGDAELLRDALARFPGAVGNRHQLDPRLGAKLGQMVEPGIGPGADEADTDRLVGHGGKW